MPTLQALFLLHQHQRQCPQPAQRRRIHDHVRELQLPSAPQQPAGPPHTRPGRQAGAAAWLHFTDEELRTGTRLPSALLANGAGGARARGGAGQRLTPGLTPGAGNEPLQQLLQP